jgi:hypothetical protein
VYIETNALNAFFAVTAKDQQSRKVDVSAARERNAKGSSEVAANLARELIQIPTLACSTTNAGDSSNNT